VPDQGQQVHAEHSDVEVDLPGGLSGVGVELRPVRPGDRRQFGDRLQGAGLGVAECDRHERGFVADRGPQVGRVDAAEPVVATTLSKAC
jgi:hypothetical protein